MNKPKKPSQSERDAVPLRDLRNFQAEQRDFADYMAGQADPPLPRDVIMIIHKDGTVEYKDYRNTNEGGEA